MMVSTLSGRYIELKVAHSSSDLGVFNWPDHDETVYLALATDDILVCSTT